MEWGSVFCPSELFILLLSKDFLTITHENVGVRVPKTQTKENVKLLGLNWSRSLWTEKQNGLFTKWSLAGGRWCSLITTRNGRCVILILMCCT